MTTQPDDGATEVSEVVLPAAAPEPSIPPYGIWVGPRDAPATYERLECVGGGSEGAVYRGRFVGQGRESTRLVALKELRRPAGAAPDWPNDGTWAHINDQAGLLRGLPANPHLVQVQWPFLGDVSPSPTPAFQTPYLVMEWIDGKPPAMLLDDRQVPVVERAGWVRDLAQVIDLLHSATRTDNNPIAHGDIKPGNCLITADRGLVLIDTGAITRLDSEVTRRGLCTPRYAAPEVLAAPERPRSGASDLFSLGAVAYYFLVGEPPPSAEDPGYHDEIRRRLAETSWGLGSETVRELLARYLSPEPATRTGLAPVTWSDRIASALTTRRRRVLQGAAAALTVVLAATGYSFWPDDSAPRQELLPANTSEFAVFGQKWAGFPASVDGDDLSITTPTGAGRFDHLWGFYLADQHCAARVEFDLRAEAVGTDDNFGIGVAPRSTLDGDQPQGYSIQYEWETADVTSRPGPYVRPAELPGGAWSVDVAPTAAPDLRTRRHVVVSASGSTMTIGIEGREVAEYDVPQVECGGVAIRAWGAAATFSNIRVSGS
jgi:hypothetical protein